MSKFIVSYGGGVTSAEALKRCIEKHGRENTVAVFADVGQVRDEQGRVVDGEDDDLYRFMEDVEKLLDFQITRIKSQKYGPGIWSVFFGERCMGNSRLDPCSRALKRKPLDEFINARYMPLAGDTRVTGLDWTEPQRLRDFSDAMQPWPVWFPLCDEPRKSKAQLIVQWQQCYGIEPPRIYEEDFTHNNCSGFCVKGGIWHFYNLWKNRPWVYLHHEAQEAKFRATIGQHTILKTQTMAELRVRFESGYVPIKRVGGCRGQCVIPVKGEFKEAA